MNNTTTHAAEVAGRVLIAGIFLVAGISKIGGYAGTQAFMESVGVPGALLPGVIALEIGGAILIMAGLWTRFTAAALAVFTLAAAVLFHADFGNQMQQILFMKNIAIAGGFMFLVAKGAGAWSLDARRSRA